MLPLSFRFEQAGSAHRAKGFDSGWRSFGDTLITRITGGPYRIQAAGEAYEIAPGAGFLIPPGLRHRVSSRGARGCTATFAHLECRVYELQGLFTLLERPIVFTRAQAKRVGGCNAQLAECLAAGPTVAASARSAALLAELIGIAAEACPALEERWRDPARERLLPLLRHIQDRIADPLDRERLAGVLGVSVPHLHSLVVAAFGVAPMELVRRERMQHARQLLQWSALPVAEVGRRCGFEDPYYFSRAFRREEGASPRAYRAALVGSEA